MKMVQNITKLSTINIHNILWTMNNSNMIRFLLILLFKKTNFSPSVDHFSETTNIKIKQKGEV